MTPVSAHKKALRAQLRQRLQQLDAQDIHDRSQAAAQQLCQCKVFAKAQAVMLFLPMPHEVDAQPVAIRAWQMGKTVTVPLVSYEQKHMLPVEIRSLNEPMSTDRYGVRSPANGQPLPIDMIDLVVVPGLAFDREGHRVGRGGGFYDRFLAQPVFKGVTCGLCFDDQLLQEVPVVSHDVPLHMLVTDRQVLMFNHRPK